MGEDKSKDTNKSVEVNEEWDHENDVVDDPAEGNGSDTDKKEDVKTFTQEQVAKMMTREKTQGRMAVMKELGINPNDTAAVNQFKAFIAAQKTEEQKRKEVEAENAEKQKEIELRALTAEAKVEALKQGVKSQYVDDIVTLALNKVSDDKDFTTIIGEFKIKYASWFGTEDNEETENGKDGKKKPESTKKPEKDTNVGKKGTGSSIKTPDTGANGEELSLGARLAAQRKAASGNSSYWGKTRKS